MTRVKLNIGGVRYETEEETLKTFSKSRLARESSGDKELFYDRNPYIFSFILDTYRYGSLHLPRDICSSYLQAELDFWEIPVDALRPCCFKVLYGQEEDVNDIEFISKTFPHLSLCDGGTNSVRNIPCKSTVLKIWNFVDDANSSRQALAYALVLFCCTMVAFILDAMKSINVFHENVMSDDSLAKVAQYLDWNITNPKLALLTLRPAVGAEIVYWICSVFLCMDTLLRIIFCPNKRMYFKHIFNYGDLLHAFAFILRKSIFTSGAVKIESGMRILWVFIVLQAMAGLKVAKLFRLGLNIPTVKLLHVSVLSNYRELLFLLTIVLTFTSLLGPLAFLVEYTADGNINDILTSFWWAAITMTTVGYGDHYPVTSLGRSVGLVCAVFGVLVLAMPIGILASSFNDKNSNYKLLDKHCERRKGTRRREYGLGDCGNVGHKLVRPATEKS